MYGILERKDKTGKMTELYLDWSPSTDRTRIEVPLVLWKLVIDEDTNESVAFFTSNDTDMDEKQIQLFSTLCNSVCDELMYDFNTDPKAGYTLCCTYDEFAKHIQFLPVKLTKTKLLKNEKHIEKKMAKKSKPSKRSKGSKDSKDSKQSE